MSTSNNAMKTSDSEIQLPVEENSAEKPQYCFPNAEEWHDFEYSPLEESAVLTIKLSDEFRHVFGLVYAVMASEERSERVLKLTTNAIKLNAGNPTSWMLRREVIIALAKDNLAGIWDRELSFTARIIANNRKNYQAWEHRRFVAESGNRIEAEFDFSELALNDDEKNYHAWSHRHWLVQKHKLVRDELDTT